MSLLKGVVRENTITEFNNNVHQDSVNYNKINNVILDINEILKEQLGWGSPVVTKYRVSNTTNKFDASFFHTDVKNVSNTRLNIPIYTVLLYGDRSSMQLIPNSHINSKTSVIESLFDLTKVKTIDINPGDLLIFHSSITHRGLFKSTPGKDRRLLQMFEVYPDVETWKHYGKMVDTSLVNDKDKVLKLAGDVNMNIISNNLLLNEINSFFMYLMYRSGYQPFLNKVPDKYNSYYATNETKRRLKSLDDSTINLYVPVNDLCPMVNNNLRKCLKN